MSAIELFALQKAYVLCDSKSVYFHFQEHSFKIPKMKLTGKLNWDFVGTGRISKDYANTLSIPAFSERQSVVTVAETNSEETWALHHQTQLQVLWGIDSA